MESQTKNRKTRLQLQALTDRAFGGVKLDSSDDSVQELKEGWFNASYDLRLEDGRQVIVKIAPPTGAEILQYEKNIMAVEVAAMRRVRQNPRIPVPEIYFYDDSHDLCDSPYFFMEKIEGELLEHAKTSLDPETLAAAEARTGEIIREINRFTGTYFGLDGNPEIQASTWKEAFIKLVESVLEDGALKKVTYDFSYEALRSAIHKHAPSLEEVTTPCLVHWDAWDLNFFVKDGQINGLIDFERAMWADPLMEAQFRPLSWGMGATNAMRGYGKTSFTAAEEERCWLYSLHLALVMNTECYYRNYDTDIIFNMSREMIRGTMAWLQQ